MLFNKLPNFDEVGSVNGFLGIATPNGRWALPFMGIFNGPFSSPVINGFLTILFIILSVFFICDLFQIKSKFFMFCVGCLLIAFPTVTSSLTFMFMTFVFTFSLLLEVMAVWLAVSDIALSPNSRLQTPRRSSV